MCVCRAQFSAELRRRHERDQIQVVVEEGGDAHGARCVVFTGTLTCFMQDHA